MRVLVIGDTHIDDPYLDELRPVFGEIMSHEADAVIHLGDYYNFSRPSPASLSFGTEMAGKLIEKYGDFTLLAGNGRHNWMNGHSVIDYLSYLGVKCVGMEHECVFDGKKVLFGHHMTYASKLEYGSAHYGLEDLKKYDIVLLGHQHIPQDEQYFHHVGSVFYQHFNESKDPFKRIAVIENGDMEFIRLKTPVPMMDVADPAQLPGIDAKTKVRLILRDFETFRRHVNDLGKWKTKFTEFKYELKYQKTSAQAAKPAGMVKQRALSIIDEIRRQVKQPEVRDLLIAQFRDAQT